MLPIAGSEDVAKIAREVGATIRAEIPAYAAMWNDELERDVVEANIANVSVYLGCVQEDRDPRSRELDVWEAAARRRIRQGLPLEAVLRANRIAIRVVWERTTAGVPNDDLSRAGSRTIQYIDFISSAAERAYIKRREELSRSMEQAVQLFLSRLVNGPIGDEDAILSEAQLLGHDLTRVHIAVHVTTAVNSDRMSEGEPILQDILQTLTSCFPKSLWAWENSRLYLAIAGADGQGVAKLAASAVQSGGTPIPVHIGIGSPRVGGLGLRTSFEEAQAASVLGVMLHPTVPVHNYEDVQMFDLFKHGSPIDAFVQAVLGPLIEHDKERGTRMLLTLQEFFLSGKNRSVAAKRLHLHRNTLNYRLENIERTLDGGISESDASFRIQLALRLIPISSWADTVGGGTSPGRDRR